MDRVSPLLIVTVAVFCGCMIDTVVKYLAADVSVLTIMGWRYVFGAVYAGVLFKLAERPMPSFKAIRFHTFRGAILLGAALCFFWSLTQLALAEATVIGFTAALMVAPVARLILGEKMGRLTVLAALIGFAGAVFAISAETTGAPEDGNRLMGALVAFLAALLYALTLVLVRLRSREEDALTIVMFSNVVPAVLMVPVLAFMWASSGSGPELRDWGFYALLGVFGLGIWYFMTVGYSRAEAQKLAPLEYTALIWAALMGWIVFQEVPGWRLWVGAVVIIAACMIVAFESRFRARTEARMPASDIPE